MYQFILLIHVFAAVFVIALVLVQQGKGATMGAAFGSGASQTVFGSRGSGSFLFRITISLVAIFFITSIGLNYIAVRAYKQEKVITLPAAPVPVRQAPAESTQKQPASVTPVEVNQQQPASNTPVEVNNPVTEPVPAATIPIRKK